MIFTIDENKDIHRQINELLKEVDGQELSYKCKPRNNIYIDQKEGGAKIIGYMYRSKTEIYDRSANINDAKAYFDAWVTLKEVIDYPIEEINK